VGIGNRQATNDFFMLPGTITTVRAVESTTMCYLERASSDGSYWKEFSTKRDDAS